MSSTIRGYNQTHEEGKIMLYIDENQQLDFIVYRPTHQHAEHADRCILFHNSNDWTLLGTLAGSSANDEWDFKDLPATLSRIGGGCSVVMYDFRFTGLNNREFKTNWMSLVYQYTPQTDASCVIADGQAVQSWTFENFSRVANVGLSIGGAIATITTANMVKENPELADRVDLISLNSFTRMSNLLVEVEGLDSSLICIIFNLELDAAESMEFLIKETAMKIGVFCATDDRLITGDVRMATFIKNNFDEGVLARCDISIIESDGGHIPHIVEGEGLRRLKEIFSKK